MFYYMFQINCGFIQYTRTERFYEELTDKQIKRLEKKMLRNFKIKKAKCNIITQEITKEEYKDLSGV